MVIGNCRILIVDDEEIWTSTIASTLAVNGFNSVDIADTFEGAVKKLNKNTYDLVLLDMNIYGVDNGIELARMTKSIYETPVIFLTATKDNQCVQEALRAGPFAFLTKPFDETSLIATITCALNLSEIDIPANIQENNGGSGDYFFVKKGNKLKKIRWEDVVYMRSDKNYTIIFNGEDNNEYHIRYSLTKTIAELLPKSKASLFCQANRAEYVQLKYINEICEDELRTTFGVFTLSDVHAINLKKIVPVIS